MNVVTKVLLFVKDFVAGTLAAAVVAALCTLSTAQWLMAVIVEPGFKSLCKILRKLPKGDVVIGWIDTVLHLISEKWPPEGC